MCNNSLEDTSSDHRKSSRMYLLASQSQQVEGVWNQGFFMEKCPLWRLVWPRVGFHLLSGTPCMSWNRRCCGYLGHSVNSTDQSLAINQKLDGLLALFMEQKSESRAENADLKKQISILGSEVLELKRRIDTASSSPSEKRRIPRDLSVRVFHCVSVPYFMKSFVLCRRQ